MPAIRRILIAVKDPAAKTLPAVSKGARLAHALNASVELFHGITDPVLVDAYFFQNGQFRKFQRDTRARYLAQLETLAEKLREEGLKVTTAADWDFPAHEAIVRHARRSGADLVVAECHAGRRLMPWLLHLTDWELLRTSPVPVLLVKNGAPWEAPPILAALDPSHAFAKPAKLDSEILKAADSLSKALKGPLHAMHTYTPVPIGAVPNTGTSPLAVAEVAAATASRAREGFERVLAKTRLPRARRHLVQGMPVDAIPQLAHDLNCGIVVMGAISRSGLKRVFIGNTAERVLNALRSDVLVVKPARFAPRVPAKRRGARYVGLPQVGVPI